MPNYTVNNVAISAPEETMEKIKKQIFKDDKFSLSNIIPMPKELKDFIPDRNISDGLEYLDGDDDVKVAMETKYNEENENGREMLTKAITSAMLAKALEEKYGFFDCEEWARKNWGVKWDCSDCAFNSDMYEIIIYFLTPWNTPMNVFKELSEKYEDAYIHVDHADGDMCSGGTYTYQNGGGLYDKFDEFDNEFAEELWNDYNNFYDQYAPED